MAGRIAPDFIDELLTRVDIIDILSARIAIKKKGANYQACCPFHQEKTPSFSANQSKQFYYCFGCGAHGNALKFMMEYDHLNFVEAIEELSTHEGLEIRYEQNDSTHSPHKAAPAPGLYELLDLAREYYQHKLKDSAQTIDYLKSRGIGGQTAKRFGIGFAPAGWDNVLKQHNNQRDTLIAAGLVIKNDQGRTYDRFRDRVVFPIRDRRGRTIGFGGRTMRADEMPKYLNSPETEVFSKGRELYGLYEAKKMLRNLAHLLIVEGYMDVISLAEQGINNVVATLGTATTKEHLKLLFKEAKKITFCFDGDKAGRLAAKRALTIALPFMTGQFQVHFLFLPDGEDPDSFVQKNGQQAFLDRLNQAIPLSEQLLSTLTQTLNLDTVDGKATLITDMHPFVALIPEGIFLRALYDKLAALTHLSIDNIESTLNETPHQRQQSQRKTNQPTLVHTALSYLMQDPAIGGDLPPLKSIANTDGKRLLEEIIALINRVNPPNSGILIQHLTHHKHLQHLMALANRHHAITDPKMKHKELVAIINQLNKEADSENLDQLVKQSRLGPLSESEKKQLLALLCTSSKT